MKRMLLSDQQTQSESIGFLIKEKKIRTDFQHGCCGRFSIGLILAMFDLQVALILPIKFPVDWPIWLRRKISKQIFKMATVASILDFRSDHLSTSHLDTS